MVIVVGAGFSGAVIAERFANRLHEQVLVIERRSHIGGNCYDFRMDDGLLVPLYGPHFFHTSDEEVWKYVQTFGQWDPYEHRVLSFVDGNYVPVPVNITTVNRLFGLNLSSASEMDEWLSENTEKISEPANGEEAALARVGPVLYEKMFRNYTLKQWDMSPRELDPLVLNRIPIRKSFDDRYFDDPFQALPIDGYSTLIGRMLAHPLIEVRLGIDYFDVESHLPSARYLFFTGRIDQYFRREPIVPLSYRSLRFEFETVNREHVLPASTVNFPNDHGFTRISEPKHWTGHISSKSTIIREFPTWDGEPYYPVINDQNMRILDHYLVAAKKAEVNGTRFVGRLANFKYYNMDQAIRNALDTFEQAASGAVR